MVFVVLLFVGTLFTGPSSPIVKNLGDIGNAAMAFPNLIALLLLCGVVSRMTNKTYQEKDMEAVSAKPIRLET